MKSKLVLSLVAVLALVGCARSQSEYERSINRIELPAPVAISRFELTDQNGDSFDSASLLGKPTLYMFAFTHCSDTCTYQAIKVRHLIEVLGEDADKFNFVSITIDPERDTPEVVSAYTDALGLTGKWHFLTGSEDDLKKVWDDFNILVVKQSVEQIIASQKNAAELGLHDHQVSEEEKALLPTNGLTADQLAFASEVISHFSGGYEVGHSAPFWMSTADGQRKVAFGPGALVGEMKAELLSLL